MLYRVRKTQRKDRRRGGRAPWVLRWSDPPGSGRLRQLAIGPMAERMAERYRERWQAELNGFGEDAQAATWTDFAADYLASAATGLQPASLRIARQTLARFERLCRPRLLAQVDRAMIDRYRVARAAEVAPRTVLKDLRTLQAAFGWAESVERLERNPVARLRSHGRLARPDPDALSEPETQRFLALLTDEPVWIHAALRLACLWGPRAEELAGILRTDMRAETLRIPVAGGRRTKEGRGKTIPLDRDTAGLLQELSHRDGPILWGPPAAPFASIRPFLDALRAAARTLLARVGVSPRDGKPLQFLRRTADTNMRRRGVPDWIVGTILGHGTRVGQEFYAGLGPEEIAARAAGLMRGLTSPEP